ncbi:MAG: hypothetical protein ACJ74Q_15055 [Pyrinomonadaceae bacterium]
MIEELELPDNIVTYLVAREDEELPPISAIKCEYLMTASGLMVRARREGLEACVPVAQTDAPIPGLAEVESYAVLDYPRVPAVIVEEMIARSRRVCRSAADSDFVESLFHIAFDPAAGAWSLSEPPQVRRHSSVKPTEDGTDSSYAAALIEVHVHPEVVPEFSEQDDGEESGKFRIFAIIGNLFGDPRRLRVRVGLHDHFCEIPAEWVFELPPDVVDCVEEEATAYDAVAHHFTAEEVAADAA